MASSSTLAMVRVYGPVLKRFHGTFDAAAFVQSVSVNCDLDIFGLCDIQAISNGRWRCPPIFMQFQPDSPGIYYLVQPVWFRSVSLSSEAEIKWNRISRLEHHFHLIRMRRACCGARATGRTSPSSQQSCQTRSYRLIAYLWTYKMNVGIHSSGSDYKAFASNSLGINSNNHFIRDAIHDIRITSFSNANDKSFLQTDVCFINASVINDQSICDDCL
mmetsp:Transcript_19531/g.28928  ORF Transcript_19531/g.28928 Transcript_19531/m.28928 type:complete len:217 (+) Transcript_19531:412-1062(+)